LVVVCWCVVVVGLVLLVVVCVCVVVTVCVCWGCRWNGVVGVVCGWGVGGWGWCECVGMEGE